MNFYKSILILTISASIAGCGSDNNSPKFPEIVNPPEVIDPPEVTDPTEPELNEDLAKLRFLDRATFGSNSLIRDQITQTTLSDWINSQISENPTLHYPILHERLEAQGYVATGNTFTGQKLRERRDLWWEIAITSEDQLRQRMAFALSQIFVASDKDSTTINRSRGMSHYYDIFVRNAFGNYRDIIKEVTMHPTMGNYLSHRANEKYDEARFVRPDENYARELMQLFTIGLWELNDDGSYKLDSQNNKIPTYEQTIVEEYARVFTGLNYGDSTNPRSNVYTTESEVIPMKAFMETHDTGEKVILGSTIPANQTVEEDIDAAIDSLFYHQNIAPFVSKQLIQRFVTSNPSPEYIERVSSVFKDDGTGTRGNMEAVIKAILLDEEALYGYEYNYENFGKIKEPILKISKLFREFDAEGILGKYRLNGLDSTTGQLAQSSPSVFNFYMPDHTPTGVLATEGLVSPEAQILDENTIVNMNNLLQSYAYGLNLGSGETSAFHTINLNIEDLKTIASDTDALLDTLNTRLLNGRMTPTTKESLTNYLELIPTDDDGETKAREALAMTLMSPEYAIQQ